MDENPGRLWDLRCRAAGTPGLVGSSRLPGLFDSKITTRRMSGRNCGSRCVHSNPIWMHIATCSGTADEAKIGSMNSKLLPFL